MSSVKDVAHGSRRNAYTALILSTLAMIVCFMSWSNFAPLASQIAEMFNLDVSQRTLLLATPVLLGSIMRIPVGILSDRYGGKKVYLILMAFILIPLIYDSTCSFIWNVALCRIACWDVRNIICRWSFLCFSLVSARTARTSPGNRFNGEYGECCGCHDFTLYFQGSGI